MKLSDEAVEWSRKHIKKYYDSDFFVKLFEFEAIWNNWDEVKNYLTTHNVEEIHVKSPVTFAAPKINNGFRIVHQLDPIDSIIYTALAYEIAEKVEKKRVEASLKVVCSYRIDTDNEGNFFSKGTGYKDFEVRSYELAESFEYVLCTDITDFYNQVYHHRIQNVIETCDTSLQQISKSIESFLMNLTKKTSRGVPVGPAASIIMTESLMIDIDNFILARNPHYTRYVDDIRIYADSKQELYKLLHDLTKYLYDSHRLTLSSLKTKILETKVFIERLFESPEEKEKKVIRESLEGFEFSYYDFPYYEAVLLEDVSTENRRNIQSDALITLIKEITQFENLDLGLARYVLRSAKKTRTRSIIPVLLENFDFFIPVISDVILYLKAVTNEKVIEYNFISMKENIIDSETLQIPYVKYWIDYYFTHKRIFEDYVEFRDYLNNIADLRFNALRAKNNDNIAWVREHKYQIDQHKPWDKRGIIYSADILGKGESVPWMNQVISTGDLVEKSLAKYVKGR